MDQDDLEMLDNQEGGNDISEEDEPRQGMRSLLLS